jgi:hypothetical protein
MSVENERLQKGELEDAEHVILGCDATEGWAVLHSVGNAATNLSFRKICSSSFVKNIRN